MKGKIVGFLVVTVSTVLLGSTFVLSKDNAYTKSSDKVMISEEASNINSSSDSVPESSSIEENDSIVDFKNINGEQLYNTFKGPNASEIVNLLDQFHDDSDRVVVTSYGEVLSGQIDFKAEGSNKRKIDTSTYPKGITIYDLKVLIEIHKDEINELSEKYSQ
ncbi:hypothetical protein ATZ33_10560 [Enterococcus silesiacus]|uniref:Uncharacterized protein n=1 Tax=Enterococcus silesiacus TaxID=332949 RepID=A0A0S3KC16_9ENTE|nr:hypothetical protein [Enterococcus silesiacus]ALS01800.1 hypothetical protein ATZ33_10560 [Enterococcus silesiacus]OJG92058.1 hypothetical protein RV15_GL003443 [Enterococcus silesiacus]